MSSTTLNGSRSKKHSHIFAMYYLVTRREVKSQSGSGVGRLGTREGPGGQLEGGEN